VKCSLFLGNWREADDALKKYLKLDPQNTHLKSEAEDLQKLGELTEKAISSFDQQKYQVSLGYLEKVLNIASASELFKIKKVQCLVYLERYGEARDIAHEVLKKYPTNIHASSLLGIIYYYMCDLSQCLRYFNHFSPNSSNFSEELNLKIGALALKQKIDSAEELFKNGKYMEACLLYTSALKIDTTHKKMNSIILYKRAQAYSRLGNTKHCIEDCTTALELNALNLDALELRAQSQFVMGNYRECIKDCEAALRTRKGIEIEDLLKRAKQKLETPKPEPTKQEKPSPYVILGVKETATAAEIKKAFNEKSLNCHPDKFNNESDEVKKAKTDQFRQLLEARDECLAKLNK
jgi:tetratricopeptide (TPR) repeat protein